MKQKLRVIYNDDTQELIDIDSMSVQFDKNILYYKEANAYVWGQIPLENIKIIASFIVDDDYTEN